MSLGTNIKRIRESKGIEIDEIVKKLNIFISIYANIEKNIIKPNSVLLKKIATALGVSENDIKNFDEEKANAKSVLQQQIDLRNLNITAKELDTTIKEKSSPFSKKPILITVEEFEEISNDINIVGENTNYIEEGQEEDIDPFEGLIFNEGKTFSPQLLNWVEPYTIAGVRKTLFYTEVNSGLKRGDRVFIVNGNYDNNLLIKGDKYKRGRDGYKVLFIDGCKIALDIDYTGVLPYNETIIDDFINIYYIRDKYDFVQANRQLTTRGDSVDYKFNAYQNNIIYTDQDFPNPILRWGETLGLTGSPGFFVKSGTSSWINITSDITSGSYSIALSTTYSNNNRIKIHNGTFTYSVGQSVVEFKEGYVYKWDTAPENDGIPGTYSTWTVDVTYRKPIVTKSNFRNGNFKGRWNGGLFGTSDKKINWRGDVAKWFAGTLLNTRWLNGSFDSLYTLENSFLADFDQNGIPFQKVNEINNNGWSFNYAIDSEFQISTINNGNIIGSKIGIDATTYSIVEKHLLDESIDYNNKINKAIFTDCSFLGGIIANSDIKKSRLLNTKIDNSRSINSSYKLSVIKDSSYISDEIVKISRYDEFSISEVNINGASHKVYKFYISKKDYENIKIRERFYLKGIKIKDDKLPLNFFDKRFRVSTWTEYENHYWDGLSIPEVIDNSFYKRGYEVGVFLSTPGDNKWKYNTFFDGSNHYSDITTPNSGYSIDIVVSIFDKNLQPISGLDFNSSSSVFGTPSTTNTIDISDAYVLNSDFESGLFENSDWVNGYHINYQNDVNITDYTLEGGFYDLAIVTASSTIVANTLFDIDTTLPEAGTDCLESGNIVFLNSVYYDTTGKVDSITISAVGSSYSTANGLSASGGSGQDLTVDVVANTIGAVISASITASGSNYVDGSYPSEPAVGGSGSGLEFDITISSNSLISATISNPGSGYQVGNTVSISGGSPEAIIQIDAIENGEVISVNINTSGIGYQIGDILTIQDGDFNATIEVTSLTGSLVRLPDTYKVTSNVNGNLTLQDINGTASLITTLLDGGKFWTPGAENRWGYIHKAKISKSKIKSGIFKGSYIKDSIIENIDYNTNDKDFENLQKIKSLVISDTIFNDNGNQLSKALYMNSNIVNGSDKFNDGIVFNSIWNGAKFLNGTFRESTWLDGEFINGVFYRNNSFDGVPTVDYQNYTTDRIKSYYKSGSTSPTISNDRYSWRGGLFTNGLFYRSDWEGGNYKNGTFYYSKFYSGTIDGGIFGDQTIQADKTRIYNGLVNYAIARNAHFYADDTSYSSLIGNTNTTSTILWKDGVFESGIFGAKPCELAGFNNVVNTVAVQDDGKFIVGGFFTQSGTGVNRNRIIRFNQNNSIDYSFSIGTGFNTGSVNAIAIQSDGKILVGGSFIQYNGVTVNRIVRLEEDGTIDATFVTGTGFGGFGTTVNTIEIQSDGKILVGGSFTSYNGTSGLGRIVRLEEDGTIDGTFVTGTGFGNTVNAIKLEDSGDALVGGSFTTYNATAVQRLVRLSATGSLDASFNSSLAISNIFTTTLSSSFITLNSIDIQSDGKIIIGGLFGDPHTSFSDIGHVKRINTNGTVDVTFGAKLGNIQSPPALPNAINFVKSVLVQADGKILVGGQFSAIWEPEINQTLKNIVRLDENGFVDYTFNADFNSQGGNSINVIKFGDETTLIIGGAFTTHNGITNRRIMKLNIDSTVTVEDSVHNATWESGLFNGGQFVDSAKWKNGTFNGGKFLSGLGWKKNTSNSTDYTWEDGIFNGGEFGNSNLLRNSTWFTGEFNGGDFTGRIWNNGILTNGSLMGSGTASSIGGEKNEMASNFADSFDLLYYGLWKGGIVTNKKDQFLKDKKIFTDIVRTRSSVRQRTAKVSNALWLSGTFNHPTGEMNNCVWLDGDFKAGLFKNSSFNPYVKRGGATQSSFNINDDTCYWENGELDDSEFQISRWKGGRFLLGTATGMIWEDGVSNYMNAYNVFWEGGVWRNGNWYGSSLLFDDIEVTDDWNKQILARGMEWRGTSSCHIWNIFGPIGGGETPILTATASTAFNSPGPNRWVTEVVSGNPAWAFDTTSLKRVSAGNLLLPRFLRYQLPSNQTFGGGKTYKIRTEFVDMFANAYLYIAPFGLATYATNYSGIVGATFSETTILIPDTITTNIAIEYKAFRGFQSTTFGITKVVITEIDTKPVYQLTDNNKQFLMTTSDDYYGSTLSVIGGNTNSLYQLTIETNDEDGATVSNTITSKIGNGLFKAGIWENGVWNSGWRKDDVVVEFDSIQIFFSTSTDSKKWRVFLKGNQFASDAFQIGDKVSIGNIVSIDINGERKLMRGTFTMINKWISADNGQFGWIVEYTSTFPLRRIEADSANHKIKVTKNVWLSGAFLNGYFEGVWSGGLFKGYPYITEMYNTHMVDGIFDGGHFHSEYPTFTTTGSYGSMVDSKLKFGVTFSETHSLVAGDEVTVANDVDFDDAGVKFDMKVLSVVNEYSVLFDRNYLGVITALFNGPGSVRRKKATGLVQNFKFYDNNVGDETTADFTSLSAIVTTEDKKGIFNYNSWIDVNYNEDVATNIGRDQISFDNRVEYSRTNLYGRTTDDILSSVSSFKDSNTNELRVYNLGTKWKVFNDFLGRISEFNEPFQTPISMGNFFGNGWTFSYTVLGQTGSGDLYQIQRTDSESLSIKVQNPPVGPTYSEFVLDNTNITMERGRYALIEFDLNIPDDYQSNTDILDIYEIPGIWFRNEVGFTPDGNFEFGGVTYSSAIDHTKTAKLKKSEFFFNRRNLDMILTNRNGLEIILDNLKYYEVDMIPFFKYTTGDYINDAVQIPYQAVAPFIDYTNSQFVFLDNITFGIDSIS